MGSKKITCRLGSSKMEVAEDRLSTLPVPLIELILSFLPLKEAMRTSILSRSWVHLWRSIPKLDVKHLFIRRPERNHDQFMESQRKFVDVVDRCLLVRQSPLWSLQLELFLFNPLLVASLERWIWHSFSIGTLLELKVHLFGIHDDVTFFLDVPKLPQLSSSKAFNSLKLICLDVVDYGLRVTEDLIKHLSLNCLLLEDLTICGCIIIGNITICGGAGSRLKNVTIKDCSDWGKLEIVAPNLQSFNFMGSNLSTKQMHMPSLLSADIDYVEHWRHVGQHDIGVFSKEFAHVSLLELKVRSYEIFKHAPLPFHFQNLVQLRLSFCRRNSHHSTMWSDLWILLAACPCLQFMCFFYAWERGVFRRPDEIPKCLIRHLKTVEVTLFQGQEDEMQFIAFLLEVAATLERVHIGIDKATPVSKDKISASIVKLPRKSNFTEIAFSVVDRVRTRMLVAV